MHAHSMQHWTHEHVFLGRDHARNERRTRIVIGLCGAMMVAEIVGGMLFRSMALIADGLHMSTHAAALLIAALAYIFARRRAHDARFTFGTGKFGDLAGFTSAIVLAMIALLIGWESVERLIRPVPIGSPTSIYSELARVTTRSWRRSCCITPSLRGATRNGCRPFLASAM